VFGRARSGTWQSDSTRKLECNTTSVRGLVEEWLRASQASKVFRVTEESIAEFKKRYVSFPSIARMTNSASWGVPEHLQEMQLPDAGCKADGQEEQPSVHSRGAAARVALLAIEPKTEVAIKLALALCRRFHLMRKFVAIFSSHGASDSHLMGAKSI